MLRGVIPSVLIGAKAQTGGTTRTHKHPHTRHSLLRVAVHSSALIPVVWFHLSAQRLIINTSIRRLHTVTANLLPPYSVRWHSWSWKVV